MYPTGLRWLDAFTCDRITNKAEGLCGFSESVSACGWAGMQLVTLKNEPEEGIEILFVRREHTT